MQKKPRAKIKWNIKILASVATIMVVVLVSSLLLFLAGPGMSYAIEVDSGDCGLVVRVSDEPVDVTNLNPGDTKSSYLVAENTKTTPLRYYFDIKKVGSLAGLYRELVGRPLDEVLQVTVSRGGDELFSGLLADFAELDMGVLEGGESQQIFVTVHLDGPEVGNEYQGASVTVRFKFRSECTGSGTLEIRKFRDDNRNRIWDEGEPEINNWRVYVDGVEHRTPVNGLSLPPGTYTVAEEARAGWYNSTPVSQTVTVNKGENTVVHFGNYPVEREPDGNTLTVRKYNDLNGNGTWDAGEPEIMGWRVNIAGQWYVTPVFLYDLAAGDYQVTEGSRDGWIPTTPDTVTVNMPATGSRTVNFGNRQEPVSTEKATLTVRKFFDLNANGVWDEGEPEIADWKVFVDGEERRTPLILELEPGIYTVREEVRAEEGWGATTPSEVVVALQEGESRTVLFGNYNEEEIVIPPELPLTGEFPPLYFYGAGLLLIAVGLLLGRKRFGIKVR